MLLHTQPFRSNFTFCDAEFTILGTDPQRLESFFPLLGGAHQSGMFKGNPKGKGSASLVEYGFDTDSVAHFERAAQRAALAPWIWTPCFPCLFSWAVSQAAEDAIIQSSTSRRVMLMRGGVVLHTAPRRVGLLRLEQEASRLSIPFDRILGCYSTLESAGPSCSSEPEAVITTVVLQCSKGDGDGRLPAEVLLRGLLEPDAFLEDVMTRRIAALPAPRAVPFAGSNVKGNNLAIRWVRSLFAPSKSSKSSRPVQLEVQDQPYRNIML